MKNVSTKFGYISVGSLLADSALDGLIADYIPAMEMIGGRRIGPAAITESLPLFYFIVTGGTEQEVLELWKKRDKKFPDEPAFLLAHSGNNSLPAALEILARLQQDGGRGRILYLQGPRDTVGLKRAAEAIHDLQVRRKLRETRLGLIGLPSDWLVASSPDPEVVRAAWGPEVVAVDLDQLTNYLAETLKEQSDSILGSLMPRETEAQRPSAAELKDAIGIYLALKKLIGTYRLGGVSVRCFDLIMRQKTTACLAMALLNDEGVVAGCEGDLVSAMGMLWVHQLLGSVAWIANPARIEIEEGTLWLAHCTVPLRLTERYGLLSHYESGLGVSIQGQLPLGPVTLFRIGGRMLEKLWLAEGEIVGTGRAEDLCRTQAQVRLRHGDVEELLRKPLGNHLVLVPGLHGSHLQEWQEMMVDRCRG